MTIIVERTRLSAGNQVVVPLVIRKKFGLREGDEIIWALFGNEINIRFARKRKGALSNLIGKLDMGRTNPHQIDEIVASK